MYAVSTDAKRRMTMNNSLPETILVDPSRLDRSNYLLSLANEAYRCGVLTDADMDALQSRLYECLAAHILLYTNGKSTSVESDTAARLMRSLLYNADLSLLACDASRAVKRILTEPLYNIISDGMNINKQYTLKAFDLIGKANRSRVESKSFFYNELYTHELKMLIRQNDIRFDAAKRLTAVNYPMPTVKRSVRGICSLIHLLEELICENNFVSSFETAERELLEVRFKKKLADTVTTSVNLGELCFVSAILCMMAGRSDGSLVLSDADVTYLARTYDSETAYGAAIGVSHRLTGRAPEKYLSCLLTKMRAPLSAAFTGGEAAVRRYSGLK